MRMRGHLPECVNGQGPMLIEYALIVVGVSAATQAAINTVGSSLKAGWRPASNPSTAIGSRGPRMWSAPLGYVVSPSILCNLRIASASRTMRSTTSPAGSME
jgi:Flp pilus assembly pilin Flp